MDWPTVLSLAGLFAVGFGYLARQLSRQDDRLSTQIARVDERLSTQMVRMEENLSKRIDQLTERYITHLEHHPR